MKFNSTRNTNDYSTFSDAVLSGLAPDGGLYVPQDIVPFDVDGVDVGQGLASIAGQFMFPYVKDWIGKADFQTIVDEVLNFPIPLVEVEQDIYAFELFHGPTLAFKDVGARFMGRVLPRSIQGNEEVVVLVATSGDTGGAVANGLFGVEGVRVVILYPEGKVSPLQERQFASLGKNVDTIAIDGVFDDCQRLVKGVFEDEEITSAINLTTANSINIARWLPQATYYLWMYAQMGEEAVVSVPSGNFGNLTAGLLAALSGMPVTRFIAACNANDTVPYYLMSGDYMPKPSVRTIANAMDVGAPSNFERLLHLFDSDWDAIRNMVSGAAYLDSDIGKAIVDCRNRTGYLLDPHGACGYLALKDQLQPGEKGVFLATAHPAKFDDVYAQIDIERPSHPVLEKLRGLPVMSSRMKADARSLKEYLLRYA